MLRYLFHKVFAQIPADYVAAHRQWEPGLLMPPLAEVEHLVEAHLLVEQLPLMDQEPVIDLAVFHRSDISSNGKTSYSKSD